ncbi:Alpha-1,3-mannosyl-glycoprotein 2-beta-N-acetylglucosaminyltransferase [Strongyloides ratti]|uniref:Alpha-1,3-mannosyl-glycoprotein 2-beta-N-acetylglucosaminyltransferase n=1 Tax=Strongyloides ratti TaxID=34506 RepID=A0A090L7K3_STRRB|nr:Alpha-1,3-mannosyl-glycoprotein 2-beta-N-acetylglucosaminyltransferase [Strongyloides ratti]CEF63509.1 Alpha-1,3-mannosyl-glycoprotein 2-beta-N-acetylglucosaminyltransferase [Strongyloides ratti]
MFYKMKFVKRFIFYIIPFITLFFIIFIYLNDDEKVSSLYYDNTEALKIKINEKIKNISNDVIPILVFCAKRPAALKNHLNLLLKYRKERWNEFPIVISIDGFDEEVSRVVDEFIKIYPGISKWHHTLTKNISPKYKNYRRISEHYKYSLNRIFNNFTFKSLIITEDDLDISNDFFDYFKKMQNLLNEDESLMCISAWNDNGLENLIDKNKTLSFKRTDFFPGLGWMLTKNFWFEIKDNFPDIFWDDYLRLENVRKNRSCIYPEVPRTFHNMQLAGKGSSGGMYSDKLSKIKLNEREVDYDNFNIDILKKEEYNRNLLEKIYHAKNISIEDLIKLKNIKSKEVVIRYSSPRDFRRVANKFNLMTDLRGGGVPRTAYYGIVSFFYKGKQIYLVPQNFTLNSFNENPKDILYHSEWEKKNLFLDFEETFCNKAKYKLPKPCDPSNEKFRKAFIEKFRKTRLEMYNGMIVN